MSRDPASAALPRPSRPSGRPSRRPAPGERLRALAQRIAGMAMRVVYALLKLRPVQDKVVLVSRLFATSSPDFQALAAELRRLSPATAVIVLNHRNTSALKVPFQTLRQLAELATARACVTDSYMPSISVVRHRPELRVIQMWHALGAIKRFGLAALDTPEGRSSAEAKASRMHCGYTWVIAGGEAMRTPFAEAFGMPRERVLALGTPRVDALEDPARKARARDRILAAHPELGSKPLVLYAPTFRASRPVEVAPLLAALDLGRFDAVLALHPLDARHVTPRPGVVQDPRFTTMDWLTVADAVVTDYSAVVFDAAVAGLPLYFYAYDLDSYRERRGFFLDYENAMPGPIARDAATLAAALERGEGSPERVARFRREFVADGGHCTESIAALALGVGTGPGEGS